MPSKPTIPRVCVQCSGSFLAKRAQVNAGGALYCGRTCLFDSMKRRLSFVCEQCGDTFEAPQSSLARAPRFCGTTCFGLAKTGIKTPVTDRVYDHIERGEPDECWPWTASVDHKGYGQINDGEGRTRKAHQIVLEIALGRPLVAGELALHHCDNPPCCNPGHLYAGTHLDNAHDMISRGRAAWQRKTAHVS